MNDTDTSNKLNCVTELRYKSARTLTDFELQQPARMIKVEM